MDELISAIESQLSRAVVDISQSVGGTYSGARIVTFDNDQRVFLKLLPDSGDRLASEKKSLELITEQAVVKTPKILSGDDQYILLEYIVAGEPNEDFVGELAQGLVQLHRCSSDRWGLDFNNYIGSTVQINNKFQDGHWSQFFLHARLGPQIYMLRRLGFWPEDLQGLESQLIQRVEELLAPVDTVTPSLLHGDLWSGNVLTNEEGSPVFIDPAPYYGHREADLALIQLFSGFPRALMDNYQELWPLDDGWQERLRVYMLYHLMNHVNIFGKAYLLQTRSMIQEILDGV